MDCPIQNVSQNMLNGWPHTECFSIRTTWMAPYRMFLKTFSHTECIQILMDGPIQNDFPNVLNGWPHTECFSKCTKWMAPYRMFFQTY